MSSLQERGRCDRQELGGRPSPAAGRERTTSTEEVRGNSKAGNAFVIRGRGPAARCPRHLREDFALEFQRRGGLGAGEEYPSQPAPSRNQHRIFRPEQPRGPISELANGADFHCGHLSGLYSRSRGQQATSAHTVPSRARLRTAACSPAVRRGMEFRNTIARGSGNRPPAGRAPPPEMTRVFRIEI